MASILQDYKRNTSHKRIISINVMSNILSFLDNTEFNLMKLTRLLIDFGHYKHATILLEKYYSDLPQHKTIFDLVLLDYPYNNILISGIYLLNILGYFSINHDSEDHCEGINLSVYLDSYFNAYILDGKTPETKTYKIYKSFRYEVTRIQDESSFMHDFDLFNNQLKQIKPNVYKFTFARPLIKMLNKHITIKDRNTKFIEVITMKSIDYGFTFNADDLTYIDELSNGYLLTQ